MLMRLGKRRSYHPIYKMTEPTTKKKLLLPYIPGPYPDEILGSWLTRVSIHLGSGAWRALLEEIGFDRRLFSDHFDRIDYDERIGKLLNLLGTTYESALLSLTTLPYWLTFAASSNRTPLPGTSAIPALLGTRNQEVSSIRTLGTKRPLGAATARYCPECLSCDYENVGAAYWHRAHQLPNVHFCHKHHCQLLTDCPGCGKRPVRGEKRMLSLPVIVCECGTRLDATSRSIVPTSHDLRLTSVSVCALEQTVPLWDRRHVLAHFQSLLAAGAQSSFGRYQAVLSKSFPSSKIRDQGARSITTPMPRIYLQGHLISASAPEFCALLVALDIDDFDEVIAGFRANFMKGLVFNPMARPVKDSMSVDNSRRFLLKAEKKYPSRPPSSHRRHYWYLRLNDPEWLLEQFPETSDEPVPSIASDRRALKEILLTPQIESSRLRLAAKNSTAGLRAQFRDQDWLRKQFGASRLANKREVGMLRKSVIAARVAAVENALKLVLEREERPARIFSSKLGGLAGLSQGQTAEVIRSHRPLREAIDKANKDKIRRQLLWAGSQLSLAGHRLSKKQIAKRAGLPNPSVSDEIYNEICSLHLVAFTKRKN